MRSASLPLCTIFGVEIRLHAYSIAALMLLLLYTALLGATLPRAVMLWLLLLLAVAVRETVRAMVLAGMGCDLRRLVLLPTGALTVLAGDATLPESRLMTMAGPIANLLAALVMAMLAFSVSPGVNLFARPLAGPLHLLRAAVWLQVLLGGLHLLPAPPMDAGEPLRRQFIRVRGEEKGSRAATGLGQALGWVLIAGGLVFQEISLTVVGGTVLMRAQRSQHGRWAREKLRQLTVRDAMLGNWTSISASDTLADALQQSNHSLQEVYPVVRGRLMVGSVTRAKLSAALRRDGNGYVQGIMSRDLRRTPPGATLQEALKLVGVGNGVLLPVVEGEQVIGILTSQSLERSSVYARLVGISEQEIDRKSRGE